MSIKDVTLADGGWLVTWRDNHSGNYDIYQRRYSAEGNADADIRVDQAPGTTFAHLPSVTALADGGWVVTSHDDRDSSADIYQRRFSSQVDGVEDQPTVIPLSIALTDADGSESIVRLEVSGVPAGWTIAGPDGSTASEDAGVWTIFAGSAVLSGNIALTLTPAANANGSASIR